MARRRPLEDIISDTLGVDSSTPPPATQQPTSPTWSTSGGLSNARYSSPSPNGFGEDISDRGRRAGSVAEVRTSPLTQDDVPEVPKGPAGPASPSPSPFDTVQSYYEKYLGRKGSDQEINTHLTNARGNLQIIENAIRTSPEAQAYARRQQQSANQPLEVPGGDYRSWFLNLVKGRAGTVQDLLALEPELKKYGITVLRNANGVAGKIRLPDGRVIDVVRAASLGGRGFQWLEGGHSEFTDPHTSTFEQMVQDRVRQLLAAFNIPEMQRFRELLNARIAELQQEPFTASEENALRVRAFDRLTAMKEAEKRAAAQRLMAMGHAPTSGTIQEAINAVDRKYQQVEAALQSDLLFNALNERQRRQDLAVAYGGTLADLGRSLFDLSENRQREALSTFGILPDLVERRLLLAQGALGGGGTASSVIQQLLALAGYGQQSRLLGQNDVGGFLSGLGLLLALLSQ